MTNGSLQAQVDALLDIAAEAYAGTEHVAEIDELRTRAAAPLRIAIAGKVKAGKSTLLNALVGTELALTDATECTRIVTWYHDGRTYEARIHPREGPSRQTSFEHTDAGVVIELAGATAEEIDHLEVTWPSPELRTVTLIDTPGVGSASTDVAERTWRFLAPEDRRGTEADSVIYLMRHLHADDVGLLEAFHDDDIAHATPINAVAVLSRADEVGAGRLDAMESAQRVAERIGHTPGVRRLVQGVVPVAGLLAEAAATLTEPEFRNLRSLAGQDPDVLTRQLLSVDRFCSEDGDSPLDADDRRHLLVRMGVYGVRLATHLIQQGEAETATELANLLRTHSGLDELRALLASVFFDRADILKARSSVTALESLVQRTPPSDASTLLVELERLVASTHDFDELRAIEALRSGQIRGKAPDLAEAEQLLGAAGRDPHDRLGVAEDTPPEEMAGLADEALAKW